VRIIAATNEDLENTSLKALAAICFIVSTFFISAYRRAPPGRSYGAHRPFSVPFCFGVWQEIDKVSRNVRLLRRYPWPGNVQELKNVIQTAVLMLEGKEFTPEFIPERIKDAIAGSGERTEPQCSFRFGTTLEAVERELVRMTLEHVGGNKQVAAKTLGISRRSLYNKIRKHNLG
jgi:DNA-binding NtrC family response regulator